MKNKEYYFNKKDYFRNNPQHMCKMLKNNIKNNLSFSIGKPITVNK